MSFFVSKSIEDIVDENCMLRNNLDKADSDGLFFGIQCSAADEKINLPITEIKKVDNINYTVSLKTNLVIIEKLFFKKLRIKKIIIGRHMLNVKESFISSVKENPKFYMISMKLQTKEELDV